MYSDTAKKVQLNLQTTTGIGHVITTIYRKRGAEANDQSYLNTYDVRQGITYLDGLGRPVQVVSPKASPTLKDVIQPIRYDEFGRQPRQYLPYTNGDNGSYKADALTTGQGIYAFYNNTAQQRASTNYPYAEAVFDKTPLNGVVEKGGVGESWQPYNGNISGSGHTVKASNLSNTANEVKLWQINGNNLSASSYFPAGRLYKTVVKDANWTSGKAGTVESFTDLQGRMILKRAYETETVSLSTYYVYSISGRLRFIIPPGVSSSSISVGDNNFNDYLFAYKYDQRGRVTEKKVPGVGWVFVVYNEVNLPVLTQDSVQRLANEWSFMKYDANGRVVLIGRYVNSSSRSALQGIINTSTVLWERRISTGSTGYSSVAFPIGDGQEIYAINYYDDYNLPSDCPWLTAPQGCMKLAIGLPTASKTKILNSSSYLWSVNYYDDRSRLTESFGQNLVGGYDHIQLAFTDGGELISSKRSHVNATTTTVIKERFDYDHAGRITRTLQKINTQPEIVLSAYEYNELGEVVSKKLHSIDGGVNFLQNIDYKYNAAGLLKSINDININSTGNTKFGMQFSYEDSSNPQYNGNVSESKWKVARSATSPQLGYSYQYDKLNRLNSSESSTGAIKDNNYSEYVKYDQMGNIQALGRYALIGGREQIDSLQYTYHANRHTRIDDISSSSSPAVKAQGLNEKVQTQDEYVYDGNGRLISDKNNGIDSIIYNAANLPQRMIWAGGNGKKLEFKYAADGRKLQKKFIDGSNTITIDYISGFQYGTVNAGQPQLQFIRTSEGRLRFNGSVFVYEYDLKDNLGNIRTTIDADPSDVSQRTARVIQENSYYAFGMVMPNPDVNYTSGEKNNYLYNGKELQEELGQLDYGARYYDPAIGRWSVSDPLAESHYDQSAYNYVLNNPIMFIDPFGLKEYNPNDLVGDSWKKFDPKKDTIGLPEVPITNNPENDLDADWKKRRAKRDKDLDSRLDRLLAGEDETEEEIDPVKIEREKAKWAIWDANNLRLANSGGPNARNVLGANKGESRLSEMWNSTAARVIVPDVITLSGNVNMVAGLGLGGSYNMTILTRGKDVGVHFNSTTSVRAGVELGASVNVSNGWYNGDPRKADYAGLLGLGADASLQLGAGVGAWGSFGDRFSRLNYGGITGGVGPGVGGSVGISTTRSGWW